MRANAIWRHCYETRTTRASHILRIGPEEQMPGENNPTSAAPNRFLRPGRSTRGLRLPEASTEAPSKDKRGSLMVRRCARNGAPPLGGKSFRRRLAGRKEVVQEVEPSSGFKDFQSETEYQLNQTGAYNGYDD